MKTEPNACRLLARIPNNVVGRTALKALRQGWNRDGWRLRVLFSGPRERGAYGTVKKDAKVFRLYADRNHTEQELAAQRHAYNEMYKARQQVADLNTALMGAQAQELAARKDAEHWAARFQAARAQHEQAEQRAAQWQQIARVAQSQLNSIPAWVLYLVGVWHEARAIFTERKGA